MSDKEHNETLKDEEPFGLGCALEHFSDHQEVFEMIDNLKNIFNAETSIVEKAHERFSFLLNQYIEQPHLIDSHIDALLEKIISIVRFPENPMTLKHLAFKYMFVIVNVRGYKVVVRHLPHEVTDFEPLLRLIEMQDPNDPNTWATRYILLLWMSIIVMIPFDMSRFDGYDKNTSLNKTVMDRILTIIKMYAVVPDKCRDAAAFLSYKFITRQDVKEKHLASFFDWAKNLSISPESNIFVRYGSLACVATILKHGKREDLLPYAPNLLEWIVNAEFKNNSGANIQKLVYKIIQRIGLVFMASRVAAWRYMRGNRSLSSNLSSGDGSSSKESSKETITDPEEDMSNIEVPDEIEEIIDQLLQGLRNCDSIVRWCAAKGVGRVTCRLTKDLADDVVGSVLELLSPRESDGAWHGACLALAELGRRGLLLPDRLPQVVPLIIKALVYDEPRGYSSVGSHIRDAACYVCWSFSRAYESHILAPFVKDIASALLVVTCFDKEINCRRAAAAAFQENVGRQGTFPHGIDILTTADFYSVSVRTNAYLNISVYIAQFEDYKISLIDHLLYKKVDHWDTSIRELTAKALHNLTPCAPEYMLAVVLPTLFDKANSIDLNSRHGAVLAIGEILHAISLLTKSGNSEIVITENLLEKTKNLIPEFKQKFYFRGLGGELMKLACSSFIEKCSLASLPFQSNEVTEEWLQLLNECLSYEVLNIRLAASNALPYLLNEYYHDKTQRCDELVKHYIKELVSTSFEYNRMGHCLALGALPKFALMINLDGIITALITSTAIVPHTQKWAESRRDAFKALTSISCTVADEMCKEFTLAHVSRIFQKFLDGLKDYTQDKRGDIGAWVREACITGLQALIFLCNKHCPQILTTELMKMIMPSIAQQAMEKIDRTRALAGKTYYSFLYSEPAVPNIAHKDEICGIFLKNDCDTLNWNSALATFPKFVQLVQFEPYTYPTLVGLVCSIGGMTETLVKNASSSFFSYMKTLGQTRGSLEIKRLCDTILKIFLDNQKVDRIAIPMLRFLDRLFDSECSEYLTSEQFSDFVKNVLKLVQMEIAGCKDIYKLIDGITLLCQFIQIRGEICEKALVQLSILLCHRQPYVRRSTSTKLYESLLVYGDNSNINPDKLDEVMGLLSTTNWEEAIEEIKPIRNELCNLMGIRIPVPVRKKI